MFGKILKCSFLRLSGPHKMSNFVDQKIVNRKNKHFTKEGTYKYCCTEVKKVKFGEMLF